MPRIASWQQLRIAGSLAILILMSMGHLRVLAQQSVTSFSLIDADADTTIRPLIDNDTLHLGLLPTKNLSVEAHTNPNPVGSVRFAYDGIGNYQTESVVPYAIAGDNSGDFNPWTPTVGDHVLTATPYTGSDATGTAGTSLTVNFHVTSGGFFTCLAGKRYFIRFGNAATVASRCSDF